MTVTAAQLRADFPAFADTDKFPDAQVNFWLSFALSMLPESRWAAMLDHGVELMTAHQLTLAARGGSTAAPQTSKSVDKVAVSYDTSAVTLDNGGHWNGTSYGIQFLQLARMVGAGGMQL